MYYENYSLQRQVLSLKISAEFMAKFKLDDNEPISLGTPKWWDDYVVNQLDFNEFDLYFFCSCTVSHGLYNRITDYRKVWGLRGVNKGIYDNHYQNSIGRVYLGICKGSGESSFRSLLSSTVLLLPKHTVFDAEQAYQILCKEQYNFLEANMENYQTLMKINLLYPNSILLKYTCTNEVSLLIFGSNLKDWFGKEILVSHERASESVYRGL